MMKNENILNNQKHFYNWENFDWSFLLYISRSTIKK